MAVVRTGNGVSPAPEKGRSRDIINPASGLQNRVGGSGPPTGGFGSPLSRGPSVSSFRPLTRPNIDPKNATNPGLVNRGGSVPPQNMNGKRPPLSDVTNANTSPGTNQTTAPLTTSDGRCYTWSGTAAAAATGSRSSEISTFFPAICESGVIDCYAISDYHCTILGTSTSFHF